MEFQSACETHPPLALISLRDHGLMRQIQTVHIRSRVKESDMSEMRNQFRINRPKQSEPCPQMSQFILSWREARFDKRRKRHGIWAHNFEADYWKDRNMRIFEVQRLLSFSFFSLLTSNAWNFTWSSGGEGPSLNRNSNLWSFHNGLLHRVLHRFEVHGWHSIGAFLIYNTPFDSMTIGEMPLPFDLKYTDGLTATKHVLPYLSVELQRSHRPPKNVWLR